MSGYHGLGESQMCMLLVASAALYSVIDISRLETFACTSSLGHQPEKGPSACGEPADTVP
jgi:hypothetical protein